METLMKDNMHSTGAAQAHSEVSRARELAGAAVRNARTKLADSAESGAAHDHPQRYTDVADTPENRERVDSALKALELVHPELSAENSRYQVRVHPESGRLQVALINTQTGETVEEIPSAKLLEFSSAMQELGGLLFEKRA